MIISPSLTWLWQARQLYKQAELTDAPSDPTTGSAASPDPTRNDLAGAALRLPPTHCPPHATPLCFTQPPHVRAPLHRSRPLYNRPQQAQHTPLNHRFLLDSGTKAPLFFSWALGQGHRFFLDSGGPPTLLFEGPTGCRPGMGTLPRACAMRASGRVQSRGRASSSLSTACAM